MAKRIFQGMNYREAQQANSQNRSKLSPEDQKFLKTNGFRNVGWENVIALYQKIEELLEHDRLSDLSLEELFLEADRIGNKYLTNQEIEDFNQKLAKEVNEIAEIIDQQFPDAEAEAIDFSNSTKPQKKQNQKTYRTRK